MKQIILETDKKKIKSGMLFRCDDKLYLKVGAYYIETIPDTRQKFKEVPEEKITAIFYQSGIAVLREGDEIDDN